MQMKTPSKAEVCMSEFVTRMVRIADEEGRDRDDLICEVAGVLFSLADKGAFKNFNPNYEPLKGDEAVCH